MTIDIFGKLEKLEIGKISEKKEPIEKYVV